MVVAAALWGGIYYFDTRGYNLIYILYCAICWKSRVLCLEISVKIWGEFRVIGFIMNINIPPIHCISEWFAIIYNIMKLFHFFLWYLKLYFCLPELSNFTWSYILYSLIKSWYYIILNVMCNRNWKKKNNEQVEIITLAALTQPMYISKRLTPIYFIHFRLLEIDLQKCFP